MSLKPQPDSLVPADTLRVAKAAFAKGNPYLTLQDELGPIFENADFTELFSEVGQSAIPAWRLASVTIIQFRLPKRRPTSFSIYRPSKNALTEHGDWRCDEHRPSIQRLSGRSVSKN